jgi:hypothetical protein
MLDAFFSLKERTHHMPPANRKPFPDHHLNATPSPRLRILLCEKESTDSCFNFLESILLHFAIFHKKPIPVPSGI